MNEEIKLTAYNSEVPKHCRQCGKELKRRKFLYTFDDQTGEKLYGTELYCTTFDWFGRHTKEKYDSNGSEILERYP